MSSVSIRDGIKSFFAYKLDDDQKEVAEALKNSEVKSRRVVGRGGLTMDGKELLNTKKFQAYRKRGAEVVRAHKNKRK